MAKARHSKANRIVFPEATEEKVLRACQVMADERIAHPVLIGDPAAIRARAAALGIELDGISIVDTQDEERLARYAHGLFEIRQRHGVTPQQARVLLADPVYYGVMMVERDDADGLVAGLNRSYPDTIRPALQVIGLKDGVRRVAGVYCVIVQDRILFFADATVNIEPTPGELAEIAISAANIARRQFDIEPRVAMLSFSNFGSVRHEFAERMRDAAILARAQMPGLVVDGEMAPDTALVPEIAQTNFPHSRIQGDANVLIFPNVQSGNISLKLVQRLAGAEIIGPILMGLNRPVNVLNYYSSVSEIVNITALTAAAASPAQRRTATVEV
jgi:malate dehydrogenase (oxaloacetate-decarboxylating)(NADP+)